MLLEQDLFLYYEPTLIARLQYGISQAVARFVLTHKCDPAGGWHLDTLIKAVSGDECSGQRIPDSKLSLSSAREGANPLLY